MISFHRRDLLVVKNEHVVVVGDFRDFSLMLLIVVLLQLMKKKVSFLKSYFVFCSYFFHLLDSAEFLLLRHLLQKRHSPSWTRTHHHTINLNLWLNSQSLDEFVELVFVENQKRDFGRDNLEVQFYQ